jgi:hypothetical protein
VCVQVPCVYLLSAASTVIANIYDYDEDVEDDEDDDVEKLFEDDDDWNPEDYDDEDVE